MVTFPLSSLIIRNDLGVIVESQVSDVTLDVVANAKVEDGVDYSFNKVIDKEDKMVRRANCTPIGKSRSVIEQLSENEFACYGVVNTEGEEMREKLTFSFPDTFTAKLFANVVAFLVSNGKMKQMVQPQETGIVYKHEGSPDPIGQDEVKELHAIVPQ